MPYLIHIRSALVRRAALLLLTPLNFFLLFFIHLGFSMTDALRACRTSFCDIWRGAEEEPVLLPCPFCGAEGNPTGWQTQSGASGPACMRCGATAWSIDTWNTRIDANAGKK